MGQKRQKWSKGLSRAILFVKKIGFNIFFCVIGWTFVQQGLLNDPWGAGGPAQILKNLDWLDWLLADPPPQWGSCGWY